MATLMGAKLSDSGADWDQYQQSSSSGPNQRKRLKIAPEEALKRIKAIVELATYPDVSTQVDWRTADIPEAAAERAKFEKEQGE